MSISRAQTLRPGTKELNIRTGPGTRWPSVGVVRAGERAELHGTNFDNDWGFIILARGVSGWASLSYLVDAPAETQEPDWMRMMRAKEGEAEIPGAQHNPWIVECLATTTYPKPYTDETPWCSASLNWCMIRAGRKGTNSAAARSWLTWGTKLDNPRLGCIVVLDRQSASNKEAAHVGLYVGERDGRIVVLAGNQGNRVCESTFPRSHVLGYRWPTGEK